MASVCFRFVFASCMLAQMWRAKQEHCLWHVRSPQCLDNNNDISDSSSTSSPAKTTVTSKTATAAAAVVRRPAQTKTRILDFCCGSGSLAAAMRPLPRAVILGFAATAVDAVTADIITATYCASHCCCLCFCCCYCSCCCCRCRHCCLPPALPSLPQPQLLKAPPVPPNACSTITSTSVPASSTCNTHHCS